MAIEEREIKDHSWIVAVVVVIVGALLSVILYFIYKSTKALKLTHLGSGKMMADGSEQILFEFMCTEPFKIDGWVNLKNMQIGDTVMIRQNIKLGINDKEYALYAEAPYLNVQAMPMIYITPKPSIYGAKITLQQTTGTFKVYEWEFYKGVTS